MATKKKQRKSQRPVKAEEHPFRPFLFLLAGVVVLGIIGLTGIIHKPNNVLVNNGVPKVQPTSAPLVAKGGFPSGLTKDETKLLWEQRTDAAFLANPHPWIRVDVMRGVEVHDLGLLFGTESGAAWDFGVMASVRRHRFSDGVERPTIKIQSSVLNMPYMPPHMQELLAHECIGHLRECIFNQRPREVFDIDAKETDWKAFHLVESELYAYWIQAEFCQVYPEACPIGHNFVKVYQASGLADMVTAMEMDFEHFAPWINNHCTGADQAFSTFRQRHLALTDPG